MIVSVVDQITRILLYKSSLKGASNTGIVLLILWPIIIYYCGCCNVGWAWSSLRSWQHMLRGRNRLSGTGSIKTESPQHCGSSDVRESATSLGYLSLYYLYCNIRNAALMAIVLVDLKVIWYNFTIRINFGFGEKGCINMAFFQKDNYEACEIGKIFCQVH